ncbi:MAG: 2'-5' RNA ligase family protein [Patescibacteria group bacterium]
MPNKYFLGFVLRGPSADWTTHLKKDIARPFGLSWSLTYPPHITLFYPFETNRIEDVRQLLEEVATRITPFDVDITGYNHFETDVWFVEPEQRDELFQLKQSIAIPLSALLQIKENDKGLTPHFHITLAHKELTPESFAAIGKQLQATPIPFDSLLIDSVSILRKTDTDWVEEARIPFKGV